MIWNMVNIQRVNTIENLSKDVPTKNHVTIFLWKVLSHCTFMISWPFQIFSKCVHLFFLFFQLRIFQMKVQKATFYIGGLFFGKVRENKHFFHIFENCTWIIMSRFTLLKCTGGKMLPIQIYVQEIHSDLNISYRKLVRISYGNSVSHRARFSRN